MSIFKKNELEVLSIMEIFNRLGEMIISGKMDYNEAKKIIEKKLYKKLNNFTVSVLLFYINKNEKMSKETAVVLERLARSAIDVSKINVESPDIVEKLQDDINHEIDNCDRYFNSRKYELYYEKIKSLLHETCWIGEGFYVKYSLIFLLKLNELFYRKEKKFFDSYLQKMIHDFNFDETITIFLNIISSLNKNDIHNANQWKAQLPPPINEIANKMIEFKQSTS